MAEGKRVLIIEDERDNREILRAVVEEFVGHDPLVAGNGAEGLALARQVRPQLILLDLMMPDLSGFEVMRHLKGDPATRMIPIIAISALTRPRDRDDALAGGAEEYVDKPFDLYELAEKIRQLMDKSSVVSRQSSVVRRRGLNHKEHKGRKERT